MRIRARGLDRAVARSIAFAASLTPAFALVALVATTVLAQASRWRKIGTTTSGNPVFLDPRSVSTDTAGIITATVRSTYAQPQTTPKGPITASRATAMFDCAKRRIAVKETIIYHDEAAGTIYERRAPKIPGFGPVFTTNFSGVALDYLCAQQKAAPAAPKAPAKSPPPATSKKTPPAVIPPAASAPAKVPPAV
jgi:hypothetical protein